MIAALTMLALVILVVDWTSDPHPLPAWPRNTLRQCWYAICRAVTQPDLAQRDPTAATGRGTHRGVARQPDS